MLRLDLKTKNNSQFYKPCRKKFLIRTVSVLLMVGLNWTGLSAVGTTLAYFFDNEDSSSNLYRAGILDFSLESPTSNFIPEITATDMKPSDSVTRSISVVQNGNPFQYLISTEKQSGSDEFCQALELEAEKEGESKYSGKLMDLIVDPAVFINGGGRDEWLFTVSLPADTSFLPGEVCRFKFVFLGWQVNLPDAFLGFSDEEEIENSLATGGMKINKVYYDVDSGHGEETANEWIEIYNPLNNEVDISGWIIEDNGSWDYIPDSPPIPALGFAVITGEAGTWDFWIIPEEAVRIVMEDGSLGDGLDNDADRVILKMPGGITDDALSYGTDDSVFTPPCIDVAEGHMLSRNPVGFDTNQSSDFMELGLPEVEVLYPNGGEVLYVGRTYDLRWTAVNPNGPDGELSIDIWYSGNSGLDWANIIRGAENDGIYEWRVPLFLDGYYTVSENGRVKIIAWGPENFMVQDQDMSDEDFCPPIDYDLLTPEEAALLKLLKAEGDLEKYGFDKEDKESVKAENDVEEEDVVNNMEGVNNEEELATGTEIQAATTTEESATSTEEVKDIGGGEATGTDGYIATTTDQEELEIVNGIEGMNGGEDINGTSEPLGSVQEEPIGQTGGETTDAEFIKEAEDTGSNPAPNDERGDEEILEGAIEEPMALPSQDESFSSSQDGGGVPNPQNGTSAGGEGGTGSTGDNPPPTEGGDGASVSQTSG